MLHHCCLGHRGNMHKNVVELAKNNEKTCLRRNSMNYHMTEQNRTMSTGYELAVYYITLFYECSLFLINCML